MSVAVVSRTDTFVGEDDPTVFVGHFLGFLIELFLLGRQNLRNWQTALLGLLL